jgi:hypothetical protein
MRFPFTSMRETSRGPATKPLVGEIRRQNRSMLATMSSAVFDQEIGFDEALLPSR